MLVFALFIV